ncbi:type IIL restriction-modification enzyme MmeI [Treponema sp. OMZ 906]|uniref:type IIL restriction-modification enzyme MmeI n=1 Tax=Treponema sp. OMZ 906 TaxID=2563662 RepID=UPI0035326F3B
MENACCIQYYRCKKTVFYRSRILFGRLSVFTKAHATLDSAVDKLYRKTAFLDDASCVAFLFELYGKKMEGFDFAC